MNRDNFLSEREEKTLNSFSTQLKAALGENLVLIKLIGSKARGDFTEDSDLDVIIVVKEYIFKEKVYDILFSVDPYYETKISPIIYSAYEYQRNKELESPFIECIERGGINL